MSRRAIVHLSTQRLARLLALPEGLRVVAARDDFIRDGVAVIVEGDALDDQPDAIVLPDLPLAMLDRTGLAMQAGVIGVGPDFSDVTACCPTCSWERTWDHETTLAMIADAVQQHLTEKHAGGEQS